jgi:Beta-xylosidase
MQSRGAILLLIIFITICFSSKAQLKPVLDIDFPDPTVIEANGRYYAFATNTGSGGNYRRVQVAVSDDLQDWKLLGDALPQLPAWASTHFWAPHVLYHEELQRYVLFFSAQSKDTSRQRMGIGVAFSKNPEGPYIPEPEALMIDTGFKTIDPMVMKDPKTQKYYITWGSDFAPIKIRELHSSMTRFADGSSEKVLIPAGKDKAYARLVEAPWIDFQDGFYYLYYSGDNCCGAEANYAVLVARATSITGPYTRLGEWNKTQHSVILEKDQNLMAPGHNSIIQDKSGKKWIVYHAIPMDRFKEGRYARLMYLSPIEYKNGWPVVKK